MLTTQNGNPGSILSSAGWEPSRKAGVQITYKPDNTLKLRIAKVGGAGGLNFLSALTTSTMNAHLGTWIHMVVVSVLGQIMRGPIQLQCIFSYSFLASPAGSVLLSIFPFAFECEMDGEHCLSMRGLPVIFLLDNVFTDERFEKCSNFNSSVCGCM